MDSIFESDPKFTVAFEHCFIDVSLTLRIDAKAYPLTNRLGRESTEQMNDICSQAISASAQKISHLIVQAHGVFQQAVLQAESSLHYSQLNPSQSTT